MLPFVLGNNSKTNRKKYRLNENIRIEKGKEKGKELKFIA